MSDWTNPPALPMAEKGRLRWHGVSGRWQLIETVPKLRIVVLRNGAMRGCRIRL